MGPISDELPSAVNWHVCSESVVASGRGTDTRLDRVRERATLYYQYWVALCVRLAGIRHFPLLGSPIPKFALHRYDVILLNDSMMPRVES